jgi:hypothetical protein
MLWAAEVDMGDRQRVYALFLDIMGFAEAIDSLTDEEHDGLDEALRSPARWPDLPAGGVRLATFYTLFHKKLNEEISVERLFVDSAIIFSDSAFVVSPDFHCIQHIAETMLPFCYTWNIPLRAGIGYGNFARLVFSTASHPNGLLIADSPFLGSAIVRAYRAQDCSAKGFRAFLHPSVTVAASPPWRILELAPEERSDHANRELNFLYKSDDERGIKRLRDHLSDMRLGAKTERALRHYDVSASALTRLHDVGEAHEWKYS